MTTDNITLYIGTLRLQVRISQKMTENIALCAALRYMYCIRPVCMACSLVAVDTDPSASAPLLGHIYRMYLLYMSVRQGQIYAVRNPSRFALYGKIQDLCAKTRIRLARSVKTTE
jgi:hypothetical protein